MPPWRLNFNGDPVGCGGMWQRIVLLPMVLIDFSEPTELVFQKSAGSVHKVYEPHRTWFFTNTQVSYVMRNPQVARQTYKSSDAEARIRNFHIETLQKDDSVLIGNMSGGFGDQILTWPVAQLLADRGAEVHVLSWPGDDKCWWNFPWVHSINTVPTLWSWVKGFKHLCIFETVTNMDDHAKDQLHPVDAMLNRIGVNPDSIAPEDKVVIPIFTPGELTFRDSIL